MYCVSYRVTRVPCVQGDNGKLRVYLEKDGVAFNAFDVLTHKSMSDESTMIVFLRVNNLTFINHLHDTFTFNVSQILCCLFVVLDSLDAIWCVRGGPTKWAVLLLKIKVNIQRRQTVNCVHVYRRR